MALRFADTAKLQEHAKRHGICDHSRYGRWKLSGMLVSAGVVGATALLQQKGWNVQHVVYFGGKNCVFVADGVGKREPMYHEFGNAHHQHLLVSALSAVAKDLQRQHAQSARAAPAASPTAQSYQPRQKAAQGCTARDAQGNQSRRQAGHW